MVVFCTRQFIRVPELFDGPPCDGDSCIHSQSEEPFPVDLTTDALLLHFWHRHTPSPTPTLIPLGAAQQRDSRGNGSPASLARLLPHSVGALQFSNADSRCPSVACDPLRWKERTEPPFWPQALAPQSYRFPAIPSNTLLTHPTLPPTPQHHGPPSPTDATTNGSEPSVPAWQTSLPFVENAREWRAVLTESGSEWGDSVWPQVLTTTT